MIQERQNAFLIVPFWSPLASCTEKTAAQKLKVFRFSCFRLLVSCFLHTVLSKLNRVRVICFILELKVYCLKLPRKEVIQPHLPIRLPCYDFTPITSPTLDGCLRSRDKKPETRYRKVITDRFTSDLSSL